MWCRHLSFVYRLTILKQGPDLPYKLTPQQQQALAELPPSILAALVAEQPASCPPQPLPLPAPALEDPLILLASV